MHTFFISLALENESGICIADCSVDNCGIFTREGKVYIDVNFQAYSTWDVKNYLPNKFASILSVLFEYTYTLFDVAKIYCSEKRSDIRHREFPQYNYKWIDYDERPEFDQNLIALPQECLQLISYIMNDNCYNEDIELLLNSSSVLFTTKNMLEEIKYPNSSWKSDIINAMVCSSFEPLSYVLDKSTSRCSECGNLMFSISKKIRNMLIRYFDEDFAKHVGGEMYQNRSSFLHMGQPESTQRSSSVFFPQISESTKEIMLPHGLVNDVLFDYSSYLFRNIAHDYYDGVL